jgi:plastocyanin
VLGTLISTQQELSFAEEKILNPVVTTLILKRMPEGISENSLKVKLGTTIVWVNHDPEAVTITFTDKVGIACKAPVNFYGDLFGYYETGKISQGETASICFIYKGSYTYEVKRIISEGDGKFLEEISEGTIIVEE